MSVLIYNFFCLVYEDDDVVLFLVCGSVLLGWAGGRVWDGWTYVYLGMYVRHNSWRTDGYRGMVFRGDWSEGMGLVEFIAWATQVFAAGWMYLCMYIS